MATHLVKRTETGQHDFTESKRTRSGEGALSVEGGKQVSTGNGDAFVTSSGAGTALDSLVPLVKVTAVPALLRPLSVLTCNYAKTPLTTENE